MLKRLIFAFYGVVCYMIFLGTFLYAIGFIGNLGTPTTLDSPATQPLGTALAIDAGLLMLFAIQHSVVERSTYVLFSSLALILLFSAWRPMGGVVWSVTDPAAQVVLRVLFAFGWLLVLVSTFLINHFDLFGLRQVWLNLIGRPYTSLSFKTPGPYRLVRHPLYVGWFFAFWMTPTMTLAHLVFAIATTSYILLAIRFEERDLVAFHGRAYEDYRRRVPMLVPFARRQQEESARADAATASFR